MEKEQGGSRFFLFLAVYTGQMQVGKVQIITTPLTGGTLF